MANRGAKGEGGGREEGRGPPRLGAGAGCPPDHRPEPQSDAALTRGGAESVARLAFDLRTPGHVAGRQKAARR